jgi:hypothetical protein
LYAPEHLIINVKEAEKWESFIENAGMVFQCYIVFLFSFVAIFVDIVAITFAATLNFYL